MTTGRRSKQRDYYKEHCSAFEREIDALDKRPQLNPEELEEQFRKLLQGGMASLERLGKLGFRSISHFTAASLNRKFSWSKVKQLVEDIPSVDEKLKFLHLLLADYKRESRGLKKEDYKKFVNLRSSDGTGFKLLESHATEKYLDEQFWTFKEDVEIEIEKLERFKELDRDPGIREDDEFNPMKRGLSRQMAMLIIDELFPNLKDASNTAKAEFLKLMTGYSSAGFRNKWSDYRQGNPESLKADMEKVANWKKKLKISDQQK